MELHAPKYKKSQPISPDNDEEGERHYIHYNALHTALDGIILTTQAAGSGLLVIYKYGS